MASDVHAEPAIYHDDFAEEVEAQLCRAHAVLVWHNPIECGRTRMVLDDMLQRVTARGVYVSTHPARERERDVAAGRAGDRITTALIQELARASRTSDKLKRQRAFAASRPPGQTAD